MIKQNHKDPIWRVRLQAAHSVQPSVITDGSGRSMGQVNAYGPEQEITAHGADEKAAQAYVEQQNPHCKVLSVEKVS